MTVRIATCRCGQLRAACEGESVRVSVCHCLDCQRRSGSAFAVQARFADDDVRTTGRSRDWSAASESGSRATFRFCPDCGATVTYIVDSMPGVVAVAVGAFADPAFPQPSVSGFEERRHPWVSIAGDAIDHFD